jgi:endonuclease III related protein
VPRRPADRFEVVIGAVLTQNTAWTNVEKSLSALRDAGIRTPSDILSVPPHRLGLLIRSSGYFNQKARKLRGIAALFAAPGALGPRRIPSREMLLSVWGVGPETADSILLYAFHLPAFVVDAYTRRILSRIGLIEGTEPYDGIQDLFPAALGQDAALFNEYHALIVAHAKEHCRAHRSCPGCPVSRCTGRVAGGA